MDTFLTCCIFAAAKRLWLIFVFTQLYEVLKRQ